LIALAMAALTCASAQAQQPANDQQACYEVLMAGGEYAPLGSLKINKCTGETWQLFAVPYDKSGMSPNRWYPLTVETHARAMTQWPQSSSASRFTAGARGFLTLSQCGERPERYAEPSRLETMPSQPSLHACLNTMSPSPS
jgi:hypothetical protein